MTTKLLIDIHIHNLLQGTISMCQVLADMDLLITASVTLSFQFRGEGPSSNYKFRCYIENFCVDSNEFCGRLQTSTASQFCSSLADLTGITYVHKTNADPNPSKKRKISERYIRMSPWCI